MGSLKETPHVVFNSGKTGFTDHKSLCSFTSCTMSVVACFTSGSHFVTYTMWREQNVHIRPGATNVYCLFSHFGSVRKCTDGTPESAESQAFEKVTLINCCD